MSEKRCTKCCRIKDVDEFSRHPNGKLGRKSWCHTCVRDNAKQKRSVDNSPVSYTKNYPKHEEPNPDVPCSICGNRGTKENPICYDHCHVSNKFRGWLCRTCNSGLGFFSDSLEIVRAAAVYLEKFVVKA